MQTVIITGLSGAGKSQAVDILEDFGFFCVDNLPPQALMTFIDLCEQSDIEKLALVIDVRAEAFKPNKDLKLLDLKKQRPELNILYLDADDDALIKRYQETRRRHPLLLTSGTLEDAIHDEREWLKPLREAADNVIDTSNLKTAQLREEIQNILQNNQTPDMQINVIAFGFKYGVPRSADFSFDARFLPNPFYKPELRHLTGLDEPVRDYVMNFEEAQIYLKKTEELVEYVLPFYQSVGKYQISVAFGCTGGHHRSVTFAYLFEQYFKNLGYNTVLRTRDIEKDREAK